MSAKQDQAHKHMLDESAKRTLCTRPSARGILICVHGARTAQVAAMHFSAQLSGPATHVLHMCWEERGRLPSVAKHKCAGGKKDKRT